MGRSELSGARERKNFNLRPNRRRQRQTAAGDRRSRTEIVRILQVQVYPKKGWIIATQAGRPDVEEPSGVYVGVWSIHDDGDVAARWKLAGPKTILKKPRGVALDPDRHAAQLDPDLLLPGDL